MNTPQVLPDTRTKYPDKSTVRVRGYPDGQHPYKGLSGVRVSAGPVRAKKAVRVSGKRKPKVVQRTLFDARPVVPKSTWKQPRHDKAADPGWVYAFIDPQQLGVHVEIPKWLESRKPSTEQ